MRTLAMLGVALVMIIYWAATVSASTTVYTDKTAWENALGGQFLTEDFADDQLNAGVDFVSTESGHINPALENYQDVLASESQNEPMTTWIFTPQITGYGGNWTLGGPGGSGNSLLVYIAGISTTVGTISNSYGGEFWGFTSDTPFTSVELVGGGGTHQQHYSMDNMVYSPVLSGDFDFDGDVDGADFSKWQRGGSPDPLSSEDLADWQTNFGTVASPNNAATTGVPEPTTWLMLAMGMAMMLTGHRTTVSKPNCA